MTQLHFPSAIQPQVLGHNSPSAAHSFVNPHLLDTSVMYMCIVLCLPTSSPAHTGFLSSSALPSPVPAFRSLTLALCGVCMLPQAHTHSVQLCEPAAGSKHTPSCLPHCLPTYGPDSSVHTIPQSYIMAREGHTKARNSQHVVTFQIPHQISQSK